MYKEDSQASNVVHTYVPLLVHAAVRHGHNSLCTCEVEEMQIAVHSIIRMYVIELDANTAEHGLHTAGHHMKSFVRGKMIHSSVKECCTIYSPYGNYICKFELFTDGDNKTLVLLVHSYGRETIRLSGWWHSCGRCRRLHNRSREAVGWQYIPYVAKVLHT